MLRRLTIIFIYCFLLIFLGSCTSTNNQAQNHSSEGSSITVAAASDLTLAFTEIAKSFEQRTKTKVQLTFGSTGTLTQQIENGAPFDVFAAANYEFVKRLEKKEKTLPDTESLYAEGRIGIVNLKKNEQITDLSKLLNPAVKKIAIANPDHAPYGMAAKQALQSAGIWKKIEDKLIYGKNISDTLTLVTTGNAEAGIVSHSLITDEVNFTAIDPSLHQPLQQTMVVIKGTAAEKKSKEFIDYVMSPEGQEILEEYGFARPEGNE